VTRDEHLYQVTHGVGILKGHHVIRPFDNGDLGMRQELPREGGDFLGQRTKTGTLGAFGDENRLVNATGFGLPELRFEDSGDFVPKEECAWTKNTGSPSPRSE
jgi:hypothetical protein